MGCMEFEGSAHKWFFSLHVRPITINGLSSPKESFRFRVPQASILGSLVFILHMGKLGKLEMIKRTCVLLSHSYLDDNQIYSSRKPEQTSSLKSRQRVALRRMFFSCLNLNAAETEITLVASSKRQHLLIAVSSILLGPRLIHHPVTSCLELKLMRSSPSSLRLAWLWVPGFLYMLK